jgi:hypothetical protein
MRTQNPCYKDGHDCPNRCVGCKTGCEKWIEWTEIHKAEKEAEFKAKGQTMAADNFLAEQGKRKRRAWHTESAKERRRH